MREAVYALDSTVDPNHIAQNSNKKKTKKTTVKRAVTLDPESKTPGISNLRNRSERQGIWALRPLTRAIHKIGTVQT